MLPHRSGGEGGGLPGHGHDILQRERFLRLHRERILVSPMFTIAEVAVVVCEGTQGHVRVSQREHSPDATSGPMPPRAVGLSIDLEIIEGGARVPQASPSMCSARHNTHRD